jgi:hypothetical protein
MDHKDTSRIDIVMCAVKKNDVFRKVLFRLHAVKKLMYLEKFYFRYKAIKQM